MSEYRVTQSDGEAKPRVADARDVAGPVVVGVVDGRLACEPGHVAQEVTDGDARDAVVVEARVHREVGEVAPDRCVELEQAVLHREERGHCGDRLAARRPTEAGPFGDRHTRALALGACRAERLECNRSRRVGQHRRGAAARPRIHDGAQAVRGFVHTPATLEPPG